MMGRAFILGSVFLVLIFSCKKKQLEESVEVIPQTNVFEYNDSPSIPNFQLDIPNGFDQPLIPNENPISKAKIALGKKLFYDPILSSDAKLSCGSCHKPEFAFSDGLVKGKGKDGVTLKRNTPTLTNNLYNKRFMHDGGPRSLENQVVLPFDNAHEFDLKIADAAYKISLNDDYVQLFQEAFGEKPNPTAMVRAIASFERTLISGNSPYDQFTYQGKLTALNESERRGKELFFSTKTSCSNCHSGFNFTDYSLQNNGVFKSGSDSGRYSVSLYINDVGLFKVPTLRNLKYTAPYMHDGSMPTLESVVRHYESGGNAYLTRSSLITGFSLSDTERSDLVAFLLSLSDRSFIENLEFQEKR